MESTIGLYKTELINRHPGTYSGRADVEAGVRAALAIPSTDPQVVAVETRRAIAHHAGTPAALSLILRFPAKSRQGIMRFSCLALPTLSHS